MAKSSHVFNPQAVYKVPAQGLVAKDLLHADGAGEGVSWKHTGPVRLPAGSVVIWDPDFVGGDELDPGGE